MARLPIRIYGDRVLQKRAKPVRQVDAALIELIEAMIETMSVEIGAGLAAPQVGESSRLIVVGAGGDEDGEILRLINPRIVAASGSQESLEGCLSLPTLRGQVQRHEQVAVEAINHTGREVIIEAEGLIARVLQHEIDHLNGVLFTDRADHDSLCWLLPDADTEDGYHLEPTTMKEARRSFARMRRKRAEEGASAP